MREKVDERHRLDHIVHFPSFGLNISYNIPSDPFLSSSDIINSSILLASEYIMSINRGQEEKEVQKDKHPDVQQPQCAHERVHANGYQNHP